MMKNFYTLILAILCLFAVTLPALACEGKLCMSFNPNYSFIVSAPKGWIKDEKATQSGGVNAAFYPKGGSWQNSDAVMYANSSVKEPNQTLNDFIKIDSASFDGSTISDYSTIALPSSKSAVVKHFEYEKGNIKNHELIAYIEEEKYFAMLVLSARNTKALKDNEASFKKLLNSYQYTSDKMEMQFK